tara:strand:+ start:753 stop:1070 length:318 start_codon:yes stop_codon:yes gene_type:complete
MKRFIIGRSWEDTPTKTNGMAGVITTAYFDIIDTHPLRDKRVVSYVTEEDTDGSGMNYGFAAAEEEAAALNKTYSFGANAGAANPLYNLDAKKVAGVEYLEAATA